MLMQSIAFVCYKMYINCVAWENFDFDDGFTSVRYSLWYVFLRGVDCHCWCFTAHRTHTKQASVSFQNIVCLIFGTALACHLIYLKKWIRNVKFGWIGLLWRLTLINAMSIDVKFKYQSIILYFVFPWLNTNRRSSLFSVSFNDTSLTLEQAYSWFRPVKKLQRRISQNA